ncbi:MAG TPA: hypothetical protein VK961_28465, partial [Chthoniobacter sp.]|nr:hypothetical protein [Chthoniobacter sp.]
ILAEVDLLSAADRTELTRRLRARELADDPLHLADASARLDRAFHGEGAFGEEELRRRPSVVE